MKKTIAGILTALLLVSVLPVTAFAAGPEAPVINGHAPWSSLPAGSNASLFCDASSPDGGVLEYMWYSSEVNDMSTMIATGIQNPELGVFSAKTGTTYYWCGVWNVWYPDTGEAPMYSDPVYTGAIQVEFYEQFYLQIIEYPDKMEYAVGETIDLTGLRMQLLTANGEVMADLHDGADVYTSVQVFEETGWVYVDLWYDTACTGMEFLVSDTEHTHSFGDWMTTTGATCTEEGIRLRECDCGVTERESIPMTEHTYDGGKVTTEPTDKAEGVMTYTCTACGATKTEPIPKTEGKDDSKGTAGDKLLTGGNGEEKDGAAKDPEVKPSDDAAEDPREGLKGKLESEKDGFPWWGFVIIGVGVLGAAAAVILILLRKKR